MVPAPSAPRECWIGYGSGEAVARIWYYQWCYLEGRAREAEVAVLRLAARGDWFLDLFTSEAEKLIDVFPEQRGRPRRGLPGYWWVPGLPEPPGEAPVAAVDGGGGVLPLRGGGAVYVARAYGYVEDGEPERLLELRYYPVRDSRVLDALRAWLEHRVALRLVQRLPPGGYLLMDGSLWVTVTAAFASLARLASGSLQGLGGVYAGVLSAYLLASVADLAEAARGRGVRLLYVSKDHSMRVLKEKVLLDAVAEAVKGLRPLVEKALEWYPVHARDALIEARRLVPSELRGLYDAALDQSYRDPVFVDDAAGRGPGYTWVVHIPPPRRVARLLAAGGTRGLLERAAAKAEQLLSPGEQAVEEIKAASTKAGLLDQLPGPRMLYLRPAPGDPLLMVEQPGAPGSYYSGGRSLEEPGTGEAEAVALLTSQYAGEEYYNIPLVAAHINATLDGATLRRYAGLLESLAAARGVRIPVARREAMARRLRRRRRKNPWV